jgi:hypothetical protein
MDPHPPGHSSLRLPGGELIYYNTGRPNIRRLTRDIRALGYRVWVLHVDIAGLQRQDIPRAEWLHAVLLTRVLILIANPEDSSSSASTRSSEGTSPCDDSDNVDPDHPERGYIRYRGADYSR